MNCNLLRNCSAVSFGSVESSNCVGYLQPNNFRTSYTMFGPMFSEVGKQSEGSYTVSLKDITPVGEVVPDGKSMLSGISVQKLDYLGKTDGKMLYWRDCTTKIKGVDTTLHGWYAGQTDTEPTEMTFEAGEAAWFFLPATANCTLQFSGEVAKDEVYKSLRKGYNAVCNPIPVGFDINDIEPYALDPADIPDGKSMLSGMSIQKLNSLGKTDGKMLYWRDCVAKIKGQDTTLHGWYAGQTDTEPTKLNIAAGEGLWVYSPNNDKCALRFPSAFAAPEDK